jgi:hypothetical protein
MAARFGHLDVTSTEALNRAGRIHDPLRILGGPLANGERPGRRFWRRLPNYGDRPWALKPSDCEILWMRHFDQLAFKEIAEVLDITTGAANVRYVRALGRLKELLRHLDLQGSVA